MSQEEMARKALLALALFPEMLILEIEAKIESEPYELRQLQETLDALEREGRITSEEFPEGYRYSVCQSS